MKAGLVLPRSRIIIPKPPSRIKLDMAFAVGAGAELKDKSRYRLAGAIVGPDWSDGVHGRCLDFVANDYVELNDNAVTSPLNFTSEDFSIIMRVLFDDVTGLTMLFSRGLHQTDGYYLFQSGSTLEFNTHQTPAAFQTSITPIATVVVATWYTIGVSRKGASAKIYKNGVDVTAVPGVHIDPTTCARSAKIGIYDDLGAAPFDGKIEFLRVFGGIALSASEHLAYHRALA